MTIQHTISIIQKNLISGFASLDTWLDHGELLTASNGTWTRLQVIEHVMLTNHFLLKLIEKGVNKSLERAHGPEFELSLKSYRFHAEPLLAVAKPGAFYWESPDHMRPSGDVSVNQIRHELRDQLYRCLIALDRLSGGQGIAYRLTMSVANLGKLDMYQYLFFLSLHIERHLSQLQSDAFSSQTAIERQGL